MAALIRSRPNMWRLALANAAVLVFVFIVLAASPAPVTFPSSHWEAALLALAAAVMLLANLAIAGMAAAVGVQGGRRPQTETRRLRRMRHYEHFDVVGPDGTIGVVAELLGDHDGNPVGLLVEDGWLGSRRFFVPLDAVIRVSEPVREIRVAFDRPTET